MENKEKKAKLGLYVAVVRHRLSKKIVNAAVFDRRDKAYFYLAGLSFSEDLSPEYGDYVFMDYRAEVVEV